jgi:hypothetical protein
MAADANPSLGVPKAVAELANGAIVRGVRRSTFVDCRSGTVVRSLATIACLLATTEANAENGAVPKRPNETPPVVMFGVTLAQDAAFVGDQGVCSKQSQLDEGYACFRESGSQYHGTPKEGVHDSINPGMLLATTRVKLGGDFAAAESLTLGLRLGYVLRGGGPTPDGGKAFKPYHLELRGAYWLTDAAYSPRGVGPYLMLAGGLAQIDSHIGVDVVEDPDVPPPPNQPDNPPGQHLEAYKKMGYSFAALGFGVYFPLARNHGPLVELQLLELFPSSGTALSLGVGYVFGP